MIFVMSVRAKLPLLLLAFFPLVLSAQEICNNGIDDDGDGLIDLNDPDCPCNTVLMAPGTTSYIRNPSFEDRICCPQTFVSFVSPPWLDCATGWHQATNATSDYFNMCGYAPVGLNFPPPDGTGAVGFFAMPNYFEYVGTCLTYPLPSNPLLAGTTYTLSLWISTTAVDGFLSQTRAQGSYVAPFTDQLPLALYGYANACVPFPISTMDCIGYQPGWSELGRVLVQPAWDWTRVSITFTPTQDIHSILIGGACDIPASFAGQWITEPDGSIFGATPYFVVDDLMLTIAGEQVLSPTSATGNFCANNVVASAQPPAGSTDYQWYRNGVALVGQTGTTLGVSVGNFGAGTYTMASNVGGECLMGFTYVPPPIAPDPLPALTPVAGCAPLTVAFADTTGGGTTTVQWQLGDGTTRADSAFTHVYNTPGSYDVSLSVRNPAGCTGDTVLQQVITVYPPVSAQINAAPNPVYSDAPVVQVTGAGSANIISWWWDLGAATPATAAVQAVSATFPSVPGTYPVLLVVSTTNGCMDTVRSMVTVIRPGVIEMPNVFSPNNDGQNDRFIPLDYTGAEGVMEIYNRWGQLIFTSRNLAQGWSGQDAPAGTYYYIVAPDDPRGEKASGHVTLLR